MPEGHCNCGAVAFAVEADARDIYVCHCSICRRWTGNNGVAVLVVPKQSFRWTRGEENVARWKKPDADWGSWFCKTCGSALPGGNDEATMFIPVGSLSKGVENLRVAHHIWVDSKAPWDEIGDNGRQHPEGYEG